MVDRYTKIVLTVIAGALVALVFQNALPRANAQDGLGIRKVAICDQFGMTCAGVTPHTVVSMGVELQQATLNTATP